MPILYILMGTRSCGKTRWANKRFDERQIVKPNYFQNRPKGRNGFTSRELETAYEKIVKKLALGMDVVFDSENITDKEQIGVVDYVKTSGVDCEMRLVFFDTEIGECLRRNIGKRNDALPERDMLDQFRQMWVTAKKMETRFDSFVMVKGA